MAGRLHQALKAMSAGQSARRAATANEAGQSARRAATANETAGWKQRARSVGLPVALLVSVWQLLDIVHKHYPIQNWLFWLYAQYWLIVGGWALACLSAGHVALRAICPRYIGFRERMILSFAVGVYVFFLTMFVGGLFRLYGAIFSIALPVVLFAAGALPFFRWVRQYVRHVRAARARPRPPRPVWWLPLFALASVPVALIYFNVMLPENTAYDARWYHLPIAEHYVAQGGIARDPEGWFQIALPHLSSVLYAWAYMLPGVSLFDCVELCAHLEMMLFLWTLAAIPVFVRFLVPGSSATLSWGAMFLFPGILLYDSSLSNAADHIAAFWAIPILLALRRAYRRLEPRYSALFALMLAGSILTKYQSAALVAFPVAALLLRAVWLASAGLRSRIVGRPAPAPSPWLAGLSIAAVVGLVATTPHWLKNFVWHGDPVYPFLHKYLSVHPWSQDAAHLFKAVFQDQLWQPRGDVEKKAELTLKALYTFSIKPHDWTTFHGHVPVFGFLFTLTTFVLPFVRARARVWAIYLAGYVAVLTWFRLSHQDRYLQIFLPWLAAAVAAMLILVWRTNLVGRISLLCLSGLQVIWGGDVYFFPAHLIAPGVPAKSTIDLMSSGHRKDWKLRKNVFGEFAEIGEATPQGSKILIHDEHVHAGFRRMSISDWAGWQGGISYGRLKSPRELYDFFKELGVTHLVWKHGQNQAHDSIAGDFRFFGFVTHYAEGERTYGYHRMAKMPSKPPEPPFSENVLFLACWGYEPGIYALNDMTIRGKKPPAFRAYPKPREPLMRRSALDIAAMVQKVDYVVHNPKCRPRFIFNREMTRDFISRAERYDEVLWVRRQPRRTAVSATP